MRWEPTWAFGVLTLIFGTGLNILLSGQRREIRWLGSALMAWSWIPLAWLFAEQRDDLAPYTWGLVWLIAGSGFLLVSWPWLRPPKAEVGRRPLSLLELFLSDFPAVLKSRRERKIGSRDGLSTRILEQLYSDYPARSKFVGFYLPPGKTMTFGAFLADNYALPFDLAKSVPRGGMVGEPTDAAELVFSGRVYVYHEDQLSLQQRASLERLFDGKGLSLILRGPDYLHTQLIARGTGQ